MFTPKPRQNAEAVDWKEEREPSKGEPIGHMLNADDFPAYIQCLWFDWTDFRLEVEVLVNGHIHDAVLRTCWHLIPIATPERPPKRDRPNRSCWSAVWIRTRLVFWLNTGSDCPQNVSTILCRDMVLLNGYRILFHACDFNGLIVKKCCLAFSF